MPEFDFILAIAESRGITAMELKIDLPADVFDDQFPEADFRARMREVAILELVRSKRMHEHEALELLGIERRELLDKMKEQGFAPTENALTRSRVSSKRRSRRAAQARR